MHQYSTYVSNLPIAMLDVHKGDIDLPPELTSKPTVRLDLLLPLLLSDREWAITTENSLEIFCLKAQPIGG